MTARVLHIGQRCRHEDNQVRRLATNSHEAQRYVAASRSER